MAKDNRKSISDEVRRQVLIEAGYRCGVPTCRNILAIDLHHMEPVNEGGAVDASAYPFDIPYESARVQYDARQEATHRGSIPASSYLVGGDRIIWDVKPRPILEGPPHFPFWGTTLQ